jgi:hypothetical protein
MLGSLHGPRDSPASSTAVLLAWQLPQNLRDN